MRWVTAIVLIFLLPWSWRFGAASAEGPANTGAKARPAIAVWDTGRPSAEALAPMAIANKAGWTEIPVAKTSAAFEGDAVLTNGRILAFLHKQGHALDIYSLGSAQPTLRARLVVLAASGEPAVRVERLALTENSKAAACLEATYRTEKGADLTARFRVQRGDVFVRVEPGAGAGKLRVECPSRFVVLPDFFADDILIDARSIPPNTIELPSENFLLHLTGQSDALVTSVFENRKQDVRIHLEGAGEKRAITASEIDFEGKKVWVALTDGPGTWHALNVPKDDDAKVRRLDWKMPFPAHWRVDFTRTNGLTDSWDMLLQDHKDGGFHKPSWLGSEEETLNANRHRWNTVIGSYSYPVWSDVEGRGFLQPLKNRALHFRGPVIVYPINRVKQTPLDAYTTLDIMRGTLGVGPCQYILDLENQQSEYRGRATCSVRDKLGGIYGHKQQKEKRAEVDKTLEEGLTFVKHIRGRIERYVAFGHQIHAYLEDQQKAHPDWKGFLTEIDQVAQQIDARLAARVDKIKTPEHVAAMNEDFRKEVLDNKGPEALDLCKKYTKALVEIGDNQDELSGECRWVVKALRQKAGILLAMNPTAAPVALEIRKRTQEVLRNPASHEGAHH